MTILVISPEQAVDALLRGLVGERGEVVSYAGTIPKSDLVVLDVSLPGSSDVLAALLKKRRTGLLRHAVIAVLSASPFAVAQLPKNGVDALIAKPVQTEQMQALLAGVRARLRTKKLVK